MDRQQRSDGKPVQNGRIFKRVEQVLSSTESIAVRNKPVAPSEAAHSVGLGIDSSHLDGQCATFYNWDRRQA